MPNWTSNEVTISGPADVIARVKDFVRSDDLVFDFDKIVPMPKDLCMESGSVEMYAINAAKTERAARPELKLSPPGTFRPGSACTRAGGTFLSTPRKSSWLSAGRIFLTRRSTGATTGTTGAATTGAPSGMPATAF